MDIRVTLGLTYTFLLQNLCSPNIEKHILYDNQEAKIIQNSEIMH